MKASIQDVPIDYTAQSNRTAYMIIKRILDLIFCSLVLVLVSPILFIIMILIRVEFAGAPIYIEGRIGKGGKIFTIYKLRTIKQCAEDNGPRWAEINDPRVTRIGKRLRKYHLDELPQLVNIIRGEMSLIGPRPERPHFFEQFESQISGYHRRLLVRPGITGWAQVNGGYDLQPETKLSFNLEYIQNHSIWFDLKIFFITITMLIFTKGSR